MSDKDMEGFILNLLEEREFITIETLKTALENQQQYIFTVVIGMLRKATGKHLNIEFDEDGEPRIVTESEQLEREMSRHYPQMEDEE